MRAAVALLLVLGASATTASCLDLGGVEDEPKSPGPDAATGGQSLGDSSFPDSPQDGSGGTGGTAGSATGGTAGSGGTDAGPALQLYVFDRVGKTWSSSPLGQIWFGPNAPPAGIGISAVTQLTHFDRLLVVTDDGQLYVRSSGNWLLPQLLSQKFPLVTALPASVFHVPSTPGSPVSETVTFVLSTSGITYTYGANDIVSYVTTEPLEDQPAPGPPQLSETIRFDYELREPSLYPSADYFHLFSYLTDGKVYDLDGAGTWQAWPVLNSPLWAGKTGAPDASTITAAWSDEGYAQVYFVGP